MTKNKPFLLAEVIAVIETMPPRATIRHRNNSEYINWFGRADAVNRVMKPAKGSVAHEHIQGIFNNAHAREAAARSQVNQAMNELQNDTERLPGGAAWPRHQCM